MALERQPKYLTVQDYLLDCLHRGLLTPGSRAPSENELAQQFGVSRLTARHALTGLVTAGLLFRQRGSGTYVSNRQGRVGVCMTTVDSYIFPEIVRGIDEELRNRQTTMLLTSSNNDREQELAGIQHLLQQGLDGLIWEPARSARRTGPDEAIDLIRSSQTPTVLINSPLLFPEAGQVLADDHDGMLRVVDYLVRQGHRHLGGIFCSDMAQGPRRYQGFRQGLQQYDLAVSDADILWYDSNDNYESLGAHLETFVKTAISHKCTAICCYNDQIADRLIDIGHNMNLGIPADLAVTGFDAAERVTRQSLVYDNRQSLPHLTSVTHPCAELGQEAVRILLKIMTQADPVEVNMPVNLIIGSSA